VRAMANDGSGIYGQLEIIISNQVVAVKEIKIAIAGKSKSITQDNGSIQMIATVSPSDATDSTVTWSILNGTGQATINSAGIVTAIEKGTVTVRATANDESGVYGEIEIDIEIVQPIIVTLNRYEMRVRVPERFISAKISIFNLTGFLIETQTIYNNECLFNISHLPSGVYFIQIHKQSIILDAKKVIKPL
jgi:hypothetical protein